MLAEFLNSIVNLAKKGDSMEIVQLGRSPRKFWMRHGDTVKEFKADPPLRHSKLASFADLVKAIKDTRICPSAEVFYNPDGIQVVVDAHDRLEFLSFPFKFSARFQALAALVSPKSLNPKAAVQWLRYAIATPEAETVAALLRQLDFQRLQVGKSDIKHGRESLGRSVESIVQQADTIPEWFDVRVPVVIQAPLNEIQVTFRVGLTLDHETQTVVFQSPSDALANATEAFLRGVGAALADAEVIALCGVP